MKDQLVFDVTDVNTIADSDSVGAYVRSSDGTLIDHATINSVDRLAVDATLKDGAGVALTSTLVGSDQALDVNMVNEIAVALDGIWHTTNNANPDNVGLISHTRAVSLTDTQQVERTTAGAVATIVAANISDMNAIDVNSFSYAIDDSTGDAELLTSNNADGGLNVHISGSNANNDGALANTSIKNDAKGLTLAGTAEAVVNSPLANRKYLYVYNNDNRKIFVGAAGVTSTDGFPLSPSSMMELRAGVAIAMNWVSSKTGHNLRTLELS